MYTEKQEDGSWIAYERAEGGVYGHGATVVAAQKDLLRRRAAAREEALRMRKDEDAVRAMDWDAR